MNARKRTKNEHYKLRYKSYRNNDVREKNKAKRIIADCNRSANPSKTLQSIISSANINPKVAIYCRKYA